MLTAALRHSKGDKKIIDGSFLWCGPVHCTKSWARRNPGAGWSWATPTQVKSKGSRLPEGSPERPYLLGLGGGGVAVLDLTPFGSGSADGEQHNRDPLAFTNKMGPTGACGHCRAEEQIILPNNKLQVELVTNTVNCLCITSDVILDNDI